MLLKSKSGKPSVPAHITHSVTSAKDTNIKVKVSNNLAKPSNSKGKQIKSVVQVVNKETCPHFKKHAKTTPL